MKVSEIKDKLSPQIKSILDYANWGYEYNGNVHHKDAEKACNYLEKTTFSLNLIKSLIDYDVEEALRDEDFQIVSTPYDYEEIYNYEASKFIARFIASRIAEKRILKFIWTRKDGLYSNKWSSSLIENCIFTIN